MSESKKTENTSSQALKAKLQQGLMQRMGKKQETQKGVDPFARPPNKEQILKALSEEDPPLFIEDEPHASSTTENSTKASAAGVPLSDRLQKAAQTFIEPDALGAQINTKQKEALFLQNIRAASEQEIQAASQLFKVSNDASTINSTNLGSPLRRKEDASLMPPPPLTAPEFFESSSPTPPSSLEVPSLRVPPILKESTSPPNSTVVQNSSERAEGTLKETIEREKNTSILTKKLSSDANLEPPVISKQESLVGDAKPIAPTALKGPAAPKVRSADEMAQEEVKPIAPTALKGPAAPKVRSADEMAQEEVKSIAPTALKGPAAPKVRSADEMAQEEVKPITPTALKGPLPPRAQALEESTKQDTEAVVPKVSAETELTTAVRRKDLAWLQQNASASIYESAPQKMEIVLLMCVEHPQMIKLLLDKGFTFKPKGLLVSSAMKKANIEVLFYLFEHGAQLDEATEQKIHDYQKQLVTLKVSQESSQAKEAQLDNDVIANAPSTIVPPTEAPALKALSTITPVPVNTEQVPTLTTEQPKSPESEQLPAQPLESTHLIPPPINATSTTTQSPPEKSSTDIEFELENFLSSVSSITATPSVQSTDNLEELVNPFVSAKQDLERLTITTKEERGNELLELKEQLSKLQALFETQSAQLYHLTNEKTQLDLKQQQMDAQKEDLEQRIQSLQTECVSLQEQALQKKKQEQEYLLCIKSLEQEKEALHKELQLVQENNTEKELESQLLAIQKQVEDLLEVKAYCTQIEQERQELIDTIEMLQETFGSSHERDQEFMELQINFDKLTQEHQALVEQYKSVQGELQNIEQHPQFTQLKMSQKNLQLLLDEQTALLQEEQHNKVQLEQRLEQLLHHPPPPEYIDLLALEQKEHVWEKKIFVQHVIKGDVHLLEKIVSNTNVDIEQASVALVLAAEHGKTQAIEWIVRHFDTNIHVYNDLPLYRAIQQEQWDCAQFLVKLGANIHHAEEFALRLSIEKMNLSFTKYLLEHGAQVNVPNQRIVKFAIEHQNWDALRLLLIKGAAYRQQDGTLLTEFQNSPQAKEHLQWFEQQQALLHTVDPTFIQMLKS